MKTVALISQKGGTGKSTLATHLAVCAEREGTAIGAVATAALQNADKDRDELELSLSARFVEALSGDIARLAPATPIASKPPSMAICADVGTDRKSAQRNPPKARTSSASVEPVKSSP